MGPVGQLVNHQELCAHVELSTVLLAVLGLPLAAPWLYLPPVVGVQLLVVGLVVQLVHHHQVCAHVELSAVLQAVFQAVLGLPLAPPMLHLGLALFLHLML